MQASTIISIILLALIAGGFVYYSLQPKPKTMEQTTPQATEQPSTAPMAGNATVTLKTNKGDIEIQLDMDKAPVSAGNFLKLAKDGFYNGVKFHRVIAGFMIQAGDPNTKGDDVSSYGTGGPGYTIADEFNNGLKNDRGTLAMANTGQPHSGGSQFFINLIDNAFLNGGYSVFGKVTAGMDVVDAIAKIPTTQERPNEVVVINSVEVK
ncbi:MAG: peptidylprolyl isomerase [Candidatus Andersenbacteria bacterium]